MGNVAPGFALEKFTYIAAQFPVLQTITEKTGEGSEAEEKTEEFGGTSKEKKDISEEETEEKTESGKSEEEADDESGRQESGEGIDGEKEPGKIEDAGYGGYSVSWNQL